MDTLPHLTCDDVRQFERALGKLLKQTGASTAIMADQGGFLISHQGDATSFDLTTLAALAAGAFLANQTIAGLVQDSGFDSVFQEGENHNLLTTGIDEQCLLIVIFNAKTAVGTVKYFVPSAAKALARQLHVARVRNPGRGFDLSVLNVADPGQIFRKA